MCFITVNGADTTRVPGRISPLFLALLAAAAIAAFWGLESRVAGDLMPHGYCYMWDPKLVWINVISDALIAFSYYCIPVVLGYFALKNRGLAFNRIFWMFAAFILACGTTHVLEVWNVWHSSYLLAGIMKAVTASVSLLTVAMIVPLLPRAISLPRAIDLLEINRDLERKVAEHERRDAVLAEAPLQRSLSNLSAGSVVVMLALGLAGIVLVAAGKRAYPDFHTIVDTCMFMLSGLLALLFWDIGARTEARFSKWMAASFAVTSLSEFAHVLSSLPLANNLRWIGGSADLRPVTWTPAAYLLPIALLVSMWMLRRGMDWKWGFVLSLLGLHSILFLMFRQLPQFQIPTWLGMSRPMLLPIAGLWMAVGITARRMKNADRILLPLAHMATVFLVANLAMVYSASPHDGPALLAHLGCVGGYLVLMLSLMQLGSMDMLERIRVQRDLRQANDELEHRVIERTLELETINQSLEKEIGARGAVEEHLRRSERRLMSVIGSAMDAIITLDADQKIVLFNQAAERMFRCRSEEVLGQSLERFIPQSFRDQHEAHVRRFGTTGETNRAMGSRQAISGLRADGEEFPIEASISQVESGEAKLYTVILRDITERTQQEMYRARLAAIVDSSEDAILSKDLDGKIVSWNKGAEKLFGYTSAEAIGRTVGIITPPALLYEERHYLAEISAGRTVRREDATRLRKDGSLVEVELVVSPVRDDKGVIIGACSVSRDVTAQREMEQELQQSEGRYRQLFESSGNAIATHKMLFDDDGNAVDYITLDVNGAYERMTGLTKAQVIGKKIMEVLPGLERYWVEMFGRVVTTGEPAMYEHYAAPLGRFFQGTAFRMGPSLFGISVIDVTERRQNEDKIAEQARIFDITTVLVRDLKGTISLWTHGAERLYGFTSEEAIGRISHELFQTQFPVSLSDQEIVLHQTGKWEGELVHRKKDGSTVYVASVQLLYRDGKGRPLSVIEANTDITGRKKAELETGEYMEDLRRSNAELEQFAYVASHDLQEPLRMVASYTELLAERYRGTLDDRGQKYIAYAVDGAKRMQVLIHDLLAYARVSSQAKPLLPTSAAAVLDSVMGNLKGVIERNHAKVTCGELPIVNADEVQLAQVFQNLITNAIKFHGERPPQVEIRVESDRDDWKFEVVDNGIGIEKEHGSRLFQMFQRLHTREEFEGSGIGLAISKRIVERHGGRIWFDSVPGEGTTFHFTIPKNGGEQK